MPAAGARFSAGRLSHDRHRHRPSGRLLAGVGRSGSNLHRRSDTRKRSRANDGPRAHPRRWRAPRHDAHEGERTGGPPPDHTRNAAVGAEREPVRHDAGRRHGMEPGRREQGAGPHRQHAGRPARRRRTSGRAGIPHRTLGDRSVGEGGRRDVARGGRRAVRRLLQRPVRRTDARHRGDVRQPAVSQRRGDHDAAPDSIAAPARRRDRHRHVRQGAARDDDRAGRLPASARHRRSRRRHAAGDRWRGRRQGPDDWRPLRARPHHRGRRGGDGMPRVRHARWRLSVSRDGRDVAGRRGSSRDDAAAQRALSLRRAGLARHGPPLGERAGAAGREDRFRSRRS